MVVIGLALPPKASAPSFSGGEGTRDMERNVLPGPQHRLALARRANMPEVITIRSPFSPSFTWQLWVEIPHPLSSLCFPVNMIDSGFRVDPHLSQLKNGRKR